MKKERGDNGKKTKHVFFDLKKVLLVAWVLVKKLKQKRVERAKLIFVVFTQSIL